MIFVADLCVHNFSNFPMIVNIIQKYNRNFLKNPQCAYEFSVSCVHFGQKAKKTINLVYLVSDHWFQFTLASYQQINKPTTLIVLTSMMWSPLDQFSGGDRPLDGGVVCLIQPLWPLTPPLTPLRQKPPCLAAAASAWINIFIRTRSKSGGILEVRGSWGGHRGDRQRAAWCTTVIWPRSSSWNCLALSEETPRRPLSPNKEALGIMK